LTKFLFHRRYGYCRPFQSPSYSFDKTPSREKASSSIAEIEDDPQIEEGDGDGDGESEGVVAEESEELTVSFPGGPTDITLLRSFKTHIAADIR